MTKLTGNSTTCPHCGANLVGDEIPKQAPPSILDVSSRVETVCDMCEAFLKGEAQPDESWKALLTGNVNGLREALRGGKQ